MMKYHKSPLGPSVLMVCLIASCYAFDFASISSMFLLRNS
jgi:hypothetical protein